MATGKSSNGSLGGIPVAYLAVWAAIIAVASVLPAVPLVGGGTFGGQEFLLPNAGLLFGALGGTVAAAIGGLIATFVAPGTAVLGLLTFYPHAVAALAAGLLVRATMRARLVVAAILVVLILAWALVPPFSTIGAPVFADFAYWPMYLTALPLIAVAPWAVSRIRTFRFGPTLLGVVLISWPSYMVNHVALSLGFSALYPEGPDQWVFAFWSGIVPLQRVMLTVVSSLIGTALIIALHRAGVRFRAGCDSVLAGDAAAPNATSEPAR